MERIILMIIKRIFIAPYWLYLICKYGNTEKYSEEERYRVLSNIVKKVNRAGNVKIISDGEENLPKENGYVLFPNHQGLFDALVLLETNKQPITFVMKKEIENQWFIKKIIKLLQAQIIDRDDIRQSMGVINTMTKEVKEGRNYVIFAEGTRSRKGNELLDFKGGSFKSAVNAKCPIIPVAIMDSYKVFDSKSIKKATVRMAYLKPIYPEEYNKMKTTEIACIVKERIGEYIRSTEAKINE
ncbi:lysophospholipid acyltransferase family protein [Bovifimicola ammoniilytica]|jgi:1-acyl-sn-glycerol-3-phosphate acyltransferase|uniref:lysophospholipid acyltransferase family protein n=1 Tax=Bovifimicola ammoniilytica TaxID=2981720 RepID=UPI0003353A1D|nr:1-acylglycerol-3-phosphate O-acyltransferase [Bovifimicola ammoniilytica]MCU6754309.1 1-acyl-sn-glycerol-3-phosphate acyltransferase [Bovifimicola ammoniilytica]CCZ05011.1 phospholipid/glycerol acyltransferase [Eubacterium sp. CAG:603]SCJ84030.1 1-acyl-sn-glycerol-3-phosphate acyltransferase [uncultured Eubacterium sp.]